MPNVFVHDQRIVPKATGRNYLTGSIGNFPVLADAKPHADSAVSKGRQEVSRYRNQGCVVNLTPRFASDFAGSLGPDSQRG